MESGAWKCLSCLRPSPKRVNRSFCVDCMGDEGAFVAGNGGYIIIAGPRPDGKRRAEDYAAEDEDAMVNGKGNHNHAHRTDDQDPNQTSRMHA